MHCSSTHPWLCKTPVVAKCTRQSFQSQAQNSAQMQYSVELSRIFSYTLLLLSHNLISFSNLIIKILMDGMSVHSTITHKKGTRYSQNSPCSCYHLLRLALLQSSTLRFNFLPNLPLILIISIPGKSCQFHTLHIVQCTMIIVSAPFVLSERFLFLHLCYTPIGYLSNFLW